MFSLQLIYILILTTTASPLCTIGVGCAAVQGSRLAGGAVAAVDTLDGLGAGRDLIEGGTDMVNNGINFGNSVNVASGLLLGTGLANKSCFTEGTQIVVGEVYDEELCTITYVTSNIEDIKVGDLVYSYDTITGEVSQKEVTATFIRESDHLDYLTIVDASGNEQIIETTDLHPFWVVTENPDLSRAASDVVIENGTVLYHENLAVTEHGYYVEAKDLRVGDVFLGANGELTTLTGTERVEYPNGITVYNFSVEDDHNYFVIANYEAFQNGAQPVLVHNAKDYKFDDIPENISKNARREARNATEQAILDKVKADPSLGYPIVRKLGDPMFSTGVWKKMEYKEKGVTIHYVIEIFSRTTRDFKFK
jgi:hypothetical protein